MKRSSQRIILPSLLDRLVDLEPGKRSEAAMARALTLAQMKVSVRRDLEWLLNSRRTPVEPPASAGELRRSVYYYGLPDVTGLAISSLEDHHKLAASLESAIAAFEPRLLRAVVTVQGAESERRQLRFQIEALLRAEPAPARVHFDTTLELSTGRYEVGGELHA